MMYRVSWEIDIVAENHEDAAKAARDIQLNMDSWAVVFSVTDPNGVEEIIDLWDYEEEII